MILTEIGTTKLVY